MVRSFKFGSNWLILNSIDIFTYQRSHHITSQTPFGSLAEIDSGDVAPDDVHTVVNDKNRCKAEHYTFHRRL